MLNIFTPADEARHHAVIKDHLGSFGTVESWTQNEHQTFVLVKCEDKTQLVPYYEGIKSLPKAGEHVRLGLGRQFQTPDSRIIYHLVAYPVND